tara:strand:+ start:858 stop:1715 length:858 start_codon:yes stop_codon:yes gene_type:complete
MTYKTIINADDLIKNLDNDNFSIVDCRCDIKDTSYGIDAYNEGHIPNAIFADIDNDMASEKTSTSGRHPLPNPEKLAEKLSQWGIDAEKQVVIYDDAGCAFAGRVWWILRWLGHKGGVAVLNGGLGAYMKAGGKLVTSQTSKPRLSYKVDVNNNLHVDIETVTDAQYKMDALLVDARSRERYLGVKDEVDPIAGHVPGAISHPLGKNLDKNGLFKSPEELKLEFNKIIGDNNPKDIISMCGSGITACHNIIAMEIAGIKGVRLYVGSWSEWITDSKRPIAKIEDN